MATVNPRTTLQANDGGAGLASVSLTQLFPAQVVTETAAATNLGGNRPLRIFLTDLVLSNSQSTAASVQILDGATGSSPIIASFWVGGSAPPYSVNLSTPIKGSPNTVMSIRTSTASATIFYTATGYAAAS